MGRYGTLFLLPSSGWDKPVHSSVVEGDKDSTSRTEEWFEVVGLGFGAVRSQALVQGSVAVSSGDTTNRNRRWCIPSRRGFQSWRRNKFLLVMSSSCQLTNNQSNHITRIAHTRRKYIPISLAMMAETSSFQYTSIPKGSFVRARRELQSRRSSHVFSPTNFFSWGGGGGGFGFLQTNKRRPENEDETDNSRIQSHCVSVTSLSISKNSKRRQHRHKRMFVPK